MDSRVHLSQWELLQAALVGVRRHLEALRQKLPDKHGLESAGWSEHIEGAAGEMAFAKFSGKYWSCSVNAFKAGDVGEVQVRTRSKDHYDLIVRSDDKDDDVFVLVLGRVPRFRVVGWIWGREAKRGEFLREYGDRPAAYFCAPESIATLWPKGIEGEKGSRGGRRVMGNAGESPAGCFLKGVAPHQGQSSVGAGFNR